MLVRTISFSPPPPHTKFYDKKFLQLHNLHSKSSRLSAGSGTYLQVLLLCMPYWIGLVILIYSFMQRWYLTNLTTKFTGREEAWPGIMLTLCYSPSVILVHKWLLWEKVYEKFEKCRGLFGCLWCWKFNIESVIAICALPLGI